MAKTVISKPKESPKLKITWWGMAAGILAAGSLLLAILVSAIFLKLQPGAAPSVSVVLGYIMPLAGIAALVLTSIALSKGERSWAVWVGFIPALIICALWAFMVVGDLLIAE